MNILRTGARIAGRLAADDWCAVYVETPEAYAALQENIKFAETLGAKVVCLKARNVADALLGYARHNGITHVIFGESARTRWDIFWRGPVINRFLAEVRDAAVHVIPINKTDE